MPKAKTTEPTVMTMINMSMTARATIDKLTGEGGLYKSRKAAMEEAIRLLAEGIDAGEALAAKKLEKEASSTKTETARAGASMVWDYLTDELMYFAVDGKIHDGNGKALIGNALDLAEVVYKVAEGEIKLPIEY